jgi:hypothetical protein
MPYIREFLYRLRPAGAPGPAGPVGVPADRRADAEQELAEIFTALAATEAECAKIRSRADLEAQHRVERAQRMAGSVGWRCSAASGGPAGRRRAAGPHPDHLVDGDGRPVSRGG